MAFKIRKTTKTDLLACSKIFLKEFNKLGGKWTLKTAKDRVSDAFKSKTKFCFCLTLDKKVIGVFLAEPFFGEKGKYLYLLGFAIDSKQQGKGFGLETLQFIKKFSKEKGFKAIMLDTHQEKKAIKMYEKFGFKKTDYVVLIKKL